MPVFDADFLIGLLAFVCWLGSAPLMFGMVWLLETLARRKEERESKEWRAKFLEEKRKRKREKACRFCGRETLKPICSRCGGPQ